uniref:Serpentine Receptor, class H n=1 Tax=Caenorhabditis japonica TaxID=281687 RepID=A0A8R1DKL5_CAEJA
MCQPDTRYLSSPNFIATALHSFTFVEVPVMIYGAYCILFRTPNTMKSVKGLMLSLHIFSTMFDMVICVLGVPYILWPVPAGYFLGLVDAPALLVYCGATLLAAITANVLALYENRYYTLFGRKTRWAKLRKPLMSLVYLLVPLFMIPPVIAVPDQQYARALALAQIPCPPQFPYLNDHELFVISLDGSVFLGSIVVSSVLQTVLITLFFSLTFYNLIWGNARKFISARTMKIQKNFAIALTIQSNFMLTFMLAPVAAILLIIIMDYHDQTLNNFVFIVLSFHGVGATIVMILVHKPYREFTFYYLCNKGEKKWKTTGQFSTAPSLNVVF